MMKEKYLFLRADAVIEPDENFERVFSAFYDAEIPVTYAVVPALASKALAEFFRGRHKRGLFCVVQYGWRGENRCSDPSAPPCEFCPERPLVEQAAEMTQGRKAMEALFGDIFFPVFVPPFHLYDKNTLAAADAAGFRMFSAEKPLVPTERYHCKHVTANVNLAPSGGQLNTMELIRDTRRGLSARRVAGAFFNPGVFAGENANALPHYIDFLASLKRMGRAELLTLRDIDAKWPKKSDSLRWIL